MPARLDWWMFLFLLSPYPKAPCSFMVDTQAPKLSYGKPFKSHLYTIQLHGALGLDFAEGPGHTLNNFQRSKLPTSAAPEAGLLLCVCDSALVLLRFLYP